MSRFFGVFSWAVLLTLLGALVGCSKQEEAASSPLGKSQVAAVVQRLEPSAWPAPAVVATNSIELQDRLEVSGDIAVTRASPGPWLSSNAEFVAGMDAVVTGNLQVDTVVLRERSRITGNVGYNQLSGSGTIGGASTTPLGLPLPISVPSLPGISAGSQDVTVPASQTQTLAAGAYRAVKLNSGNAGVITKLILSGGLYQMSSLELGNDTSLTCSAGCEIRMTGRVFLGSRAVLGPASVPGLGPGNVQVLVRGSNATSQPTSTPSAVYVDNDSTLKAYLLAPNGTVRFGARGQFVGKVVAKDVLFSLDGDATGVELPIITQEPASLTVNPGQSAEFSVVATGTGLTYQWQRGSTNIAGATAAQYTLASAAAGDSGATFRVIVTSAAGSVTSNAATLTVNTCASSDATCDGIDDDCDGSIDEDYVAACSGDSTLECIDGAVESVACSDEDACNGTESCDDGACVAGTAPVVDDGNPCTDDSCDPGTGVAHSPAAAGTACADADLCNGDETCDGSGACVAGTAPVVDDGNPCTADSCDPVTGVAHVAVPEGTSCADADLCNGNETCNAAAVCVAGVPPVVDDGNPCTADSCDPATGVAHSPVAEGTPCPDGDQCNGNETCNAMAACVAGPPPVVDDGNPCTADGCEPATGVVHSPVAAGTACADGDLCNGDETCDGSGVCVAGTAPVVDDGNPCTADSCDPATGVAHSAVAAGTACADGDPCNGDETCDGSGVCVAGTAPVVDDGNPCTADSCDPATGVVHSAVAAGTVCADGDLCNGDETCDGSGVCVAGTAPVVDDGNPCTADSCDPATGVVHSPVAAGTACADGDLCNGDETCDGSGVCVAGTPPVVDDGNPCTADSCDSVTGVAHVPVAAGTACADADLCNGSETCDTSGVCVAGTPPVVDDGNPCTDDTCDPASGVAHDPVAAGTACDDADLCNGDEVCDGSGVCMVGSPPFVDDGNPCTADSCDPATGVAHSPVASGTACADGDLCNGDETCDGGGTCVAGTPPVVDDGDPCTTDSCQPTTGVAHAPAPAGMSCADADPCNGDETCDGSGVCVAGTPPVVDDGNPCTDDACDPATGATHAPVAEGTPCVDEDVCNGDEACTGQGECADGVPLLVDDEDRCTIDSCDPLSGVSHVVIPGCDGASTTPGGRYETRASILGTVLDDSEGPVTDFTVTVYDAPVSDMPRSDVAVTTAADGSFRARLLDFPENTQADVPSSHLIVFVESPAFVPILRDVYVRSGDAIDLGTLYVLARDSAVTMVGPSGGTATDSTGQIEVTFPPGAVQTTIPVRITTIPKRRLFPYPLPDATVTMYGIVFEPSYEFSVPVTVRIENYLNVPTSLQIPTAVVDEENGTWEHRGFAVWDGSRFTTTLEHFSTIDCNSSTVGELFVIENPGADPRRQSDRNCAGSSVSYGSGSLQQSIALPTYTRQGHEYGVTLTYDSSLAGSHRLGNGPTNVAASASGGVSFSIPLTGPSYSFRCVAPGQPPPAGSCAAGGCIVGSVVASPVLAVSRIAGSEVQFEQDLLGGENAMGVAQYAELPVNPDGTVPASGYFPYEREVTVRAPAGISNSGGTTCTGGGMVFGVQASNGTPRLSNVEPGPVARTHGYELLYHRRTSALGSGWGIEEVSDAFRAPGGMQVDLVRGDGARETFLPRVDVERVSSAGWSTVPDALAMDPQTQELFYAHVTKGILLLGPDFSETPVAPAIDFPTVPTGLAIAYVGSERRFVVAMRGGLVEVDAGGALSTLDSWSTQSGSYVDPRVAAAGDMVYYTTGARKVISRVSLSDPSREVNPITSAAGGDIRVDPKQLAGAVTLDTPRGLAVDADGALYVSCFRRHIVYRLLPGVDGTVGPDSPVQRVLGTGVGSGSARIGSVDVGVRFAMNQPLDLALSPEGYLFVSNTEGVAVYDPASEQAWWFMLKAQVGLAVSIDTNDSMAPLSRDAVFGWDGDQGILLALDGLSSEFEPGRRVRETTTGLELTDTEQDIIESYTWTDETKSHARLTARRGRSGELLLEVGYDPETGRVVWLADPTGGRMTLTYTGAGRLSSIEDAAGRTSTVTVDSDNNLREIVLSSGERRSFDYDGHRMTVARNPLGEETLYEYREDGTVQTVTRPGGQSRTFEPAYAPPVYVNKKLTHQGSFVDERGVSHTLNLDEAGQVVAEDYQADGVSYQLRNVYAGTLIGANQFEDRANTLLRIGRTTLNGTDLGSSWTFDVMGRPVEAKNVGTLQWAATYADQGYLASLHPYSTYVIWNYDRDAQGRLIRVADYETSTTPDQPTGRKTLYSWRADGQPATSSYRGVTTSYSYDPSTGNLTTSSDIGGTVNLAYDAAGNVSWFDDGTQSVAYGYDGSNRITTMTDAEGNVTELGYLDATCGCSFGDRVTRLHTPDLPSDVQWSFDYDEEGRLASEMDPLGHSRSFAYSATGDLQSTTDQLSRSTVFTYDSLGRLKSTIDSSGRVSTFTYPVPAGGAWAGATLASVSASGAPVGSSLTAELPDGAYQVGFNATPAGGQPPQIELYRDATFELSFGRRFDVHGRLNFLEDRSQLDLASLTVFFTTNPGTDKAPFFDENFGYHRHSPLPIVNTDNIYPGRGAMFTRNSYFEPTSVTVDQTSSSAPRVYPEDIGRDALGRPTSVTARYLGYDVNLVQNYSVSYLPNGQVERFDDGGLHRGPRTYDSRGLLQVQQSDSYAYAYEYDEVGRTVRLNYPGGLVRRQTFDEAGRLASRCYEFPGMPTRCYTATYDAAGNPVVLSDPEGTSTISYDDLDRVVEVRRMTSEGSEEVETYAHNALGALRVNNGVVLDDERPRLDGGGLAPAGIPAAIEGAPVTLDGGGRVTAIGDIELEYDGAGLLSQMGPTAATYPLLFGYDALARMVGYTSYEPDRHTRGQAFFAYEDIFGSNISEQFYEYVGAVGEPPPPRGTIATRWRAIYDGIDQPLSGQTKYWLVGMLLFHYELDCIGNVRRLRAAFDSPPNGYGIDWTAGTDFGGYRYTAFGQQYPSDTTTPHPAVVPGGDNQDYIQQPLGWQGHYRLPWSDSHEELYDFRTRIWSPRLGAFLQPDGFGYITPTGTLWSWPGQNPMRWRDPYGNFGWEDVESGILVHGESIQNGFLLASGLAASVGLAAVAGPLLGLGTLEGALGTAGTAALGLGRAAAASAAGAGAALLRGAKGCSTDGARGALRFGANDLVYGPSARGALRQLQQSAGGKLLTDVGGPAAGQSWPQFSIQMLQRQLAAGGRIRFDLTHMQDIPGALRGTGQFGNTITAAELRFLQQHWSQFGAITTFYRNGVEAAAPW